VLASFGVRELWTSPAQQDFADPARDHFRAAAVAVPAAPLPDTWQIHCYVSSAAPAGFAPLEPFAPSTLPALHTASGPLPRAALLASSANSIGAFDFHPEPNPSKETGHDCPTLCP
jgi:hypothetical protein